MGDDEVPIETTPERAGDATPRLARLSLLEGFVTREGSSNGHRGQKVFTTEARFILF